MNPFRRKLSEPPKAHYKTEEELKTVPQKKYSVDDVVYYLDRETRFASHESTLECSFLVIETKIETCSYNPFEGVWSYKLQNVKALVPEYQVLLTQPETVKYDKTSPIKN